MRTRIKEWKIYANIMTIDLLRSFSFFQSLKETLKRLPIYVPTIIFRTGSLVIAMAYLRIYSIIPMFLLMIELGWISWIRFKKFNRRELAMQYTAQIMISNVSVLNSYAFGMDIDDHEDAYTVTNFIVQSSVITFVHHSIVLVTRDTTEDLFQNILMTKVMIYFCGGQILLSLEVDSNFSNFDIYLID